MSEFPKHQTWCEMDGGEPEIHPFCGGTAVVFTTRCPTRQQQPNEDAACLIQTDSREGVLAVADGMGGEAAGQRASRAAVESIVHSCLDRSASANSQSRGLRTEILDAIESANQEILGWSTGGGTTLTAIEMVDNVIRAFHIGDSGAMLIGNRGRIKFATVGHAPIAQAVDIGMIEEHKALVHEDRNLISNCLGSTEMKIEIGPPVEMAPRDTLLIASDGLFDNLLLDEIVQIVRKGNQADNVRRLAANVHERMMRRVEDDIPGKPDDLTIVCFRITKSG